MRLPAQVAFETVTKNDTLIAKIFSKIQKGLVEKCLLGSLQTGLVTSSSSKSGELFNL